MRLRGGYSVRIPQGTVKTDAHREDAGRFSMIISVGKSLIAPPIFVRASPCVQMIITYNS